MPSVVVTPRSVSSGGHPSLARLERAGYEVVFPAPGRQPNEDELIAAMPGCVGYLAGVEPVTRRVIEAGSTLKVISRNGVGVDNVDLKAADECGIQVKRTVGANARGVAELAIGSMIAGARGIPAADRSLKGERWERSRGIELHGRALGLLGCGSIGQLVAEIALGMGMTVRAYDPFPPAGFNPGDRFSFADFGTVIEASDVISLHCPPSPDGYVIGAAEIAAMKDGAILVNTARDGLVDAQAARAALDSGKLRAVTVDAFAKEPPDDFSFVAHDRVIGTPHIGGFTKESVDMAMDLAVTNLLDVVGSAT